jgi:hypothetical protein
VLRIGEGNNLQNYLALRMNFSLPGPIVVDKETNLLVVRTKGATLAIYVMAAMLSSMPETATSGPLSIDSSAPKLTDFSITPTSYDVTTGAAMGTVRFAATDDLSGVNHATFWLRDESGGNIVGTSVTRISGTALDGVYQTSFLIPQFAPSGEYTCWRRLKFDPLPRIVPTEN